MQIAKASQIAAGAEAAAGPSAASIAASATSQSGGFVDGKATAVKKNLGTKEDPTFGDVLKKMQGEYGAKAEKPREIKKTLGKDDFLRIMVTQMKNQDPTNPFKADQMAAQMAQYASVEQLQNMNSTMGKMVNQNSPLERLAMTNLIGKTVTVDRNRFPHTEGSKDTLNFHLPSGAVESNITIFSETGEPIVSKDMGALKSGENTFVWDGMKANTLAAKNGNFIYKVSAKDANGAEVAVQSKGQAQVVGVSFEGKEPILLVGDPARPDKVTMSNVTRIEGESANTIPGARPIAQARAMSDSEAAPERAAPVSEAKKFVPAAQAAKSSGPNYFTFQKGEGSQPIDPTHLPPEAARALAQYEAQAREYAQSQGAKGAQEGSPNAGFAAMDAPKSLSKGGEIK